MKMVSAAACAPAPGSVAATPPPPKYQGHDEIDSDLILLLSGESTENLTLSEEL
jgi:hypothetical protein